MAGDSFTNTIFETLIACYPELAAIPPEQGAHCLPAATQNLQMLCTAVQDHGKEDSTLSFSSYPCEHGIIISRAVLSLHVAGTDVHKASWISGCCPEKSIAEN